MSSSSMPSMFLRSIWEVGGGDTAATKRGALHAHCFVAPVYIDDLTGNGCSARAGKEDARVAEFIRVALRFKGACSL